MGLVWIHNGIFLGSDSDDLTFVRVKLHLPLLFLNLDAVKLSMSFCRAWASAWPLILLSS